MNNLVSKKANHIYVEVCNEFLSRKDLFTENEIIIIMGGVINSTLTYLPGCYKETLINNLEYEYKSQHFSEDFANLKVLLNKINKTPESIICMLVRRINRYITTGNKIGIKTSELVKHIYGQYEDKNMELLIRYILEDNISNILEFQKKVMGPSTDTTWDILNTLNYINLEYWTEYIKIYNKYTAKKDKMYYLKDLIFDEDKSNEDIFQEVNPIILSVFKNELIQRRIIDIFTQESNLFNKITYKCLNDLKNRIINLERITQSVVRQNDGIGIVFYDAVLKRQSNIKLTLGYKKNINHEGAPGNVRYIKQCMMS